jgi:ATP-binding cassette subfamily F protein uup
MNKLNLTRYNDIKSENRIFIIPLKVNLQSNYTMDMSAILEIEALSKYIGDLVLFEDVNIQLNQADKAALVGINGAGKTTLLNIITGADTADAGTIKLSNNIRVAFLDQEPDIPKQQTVIEALFQSENSSIKTIKEYEEAMVTHDPFKTAQAINNMDRLKLWDYENRIKQILTQLDITNFDQRTEELSGGQKKRLALANALLNEPDFLILDEPTNHLDLAVIEWLENYLLRSSITLLMVTHDRYFLDRICNVVFEIDQKKLYRYEGNYTKYSEKREKRIYNELLEVEKARNSLRKEEDWMSRMPKARATKAKYRIDNYYKLKEKSSQTRNDKAIKINVQESRLGSKILVAKELSFRWGENYYLKNFSYTFSRFEKIGLIGQNGSGKSTFLEIITQNLQPENGFIETGETIKFGYYTQSGIRFDENMRVLDAITEIAETITVADGTNITASQFLNYFLFPPVRQHDYIYKLSGGEKRRLYLCSVLMMNPNFLILDEPTNDLDITSLQILEDYLSSFNGCVLIVSHDRYFLDSVADHLFVFEGNGLIKDFPGNYTDYFIWNKEREKTKSVTVSPIKKDKPSRTNIKQKFTFNEKRELEQLEIEIEQLEKEKTDLEQLLSSGKLSASDLAEKSTRFSFIISLLDEKSDRWLELSEKE